MITELYQGEVELDFNDNKHVYTVDGKKVLSVTGITKIVDKSGPLMWWAVGQAVDYIDGFCKAHQYDGDKIFDEVKWQEVLKDARRAHAKKSGKAATIGTLAHQWIEDYLTGADPETPKNKQLLASTRSFLRWMDEHEVECVESEFKVFSRDFNYAGTCDMDAYVDGERCIVDWKTGTKVYPEHELQVTAYMMAREEELGVEYDARWVVVLPKDGGKVVAKRYGKETEDKAVEGFLGALKLVQINAENSMSDLFNGWPEDGEPMSDLAERLRYQTVLTHDQIQEVRRELKAKADEIERLWADCKEKDRLIETQKQYLDNKDSVINGMNKMITKLEGDLEVMRLQRDATQSSRCPNCERLRAENDAWQNQDLLEQSNRQADEIERLRAAINDYLHCHADPPTEQMARAKLEQALKGVDDE